MLLLARIELIFLAVASTGLCFGFVLEEVLIKQACFSYRRTGLALSQGLSCLSTHSNSEQAGDAEGFRREH